MVGISYSSPSLASIHSHRYAIFIFHKRRIIIKTPSHIHTHSSSNKNERKRYIRKLQMPLMLPIQKWQLFIVYSDTIICSKSMVVIFRNRFDSVLSRHSTHTKHLLLIYSNRRQLKHSRTYVMLA